jgi:hypothetical protein
MRMPLKALIPLLTTPMLSALAAQPARHDVAWYRAHADARTSMLATCQNDHSYDDAADCRNANSAAHAAAGDDLEAANSKEPEADPAYYGHDAGVIAMTLSMCSRNSAPQSWCKAAQIAKDKMKPQ